jgi:hypothetical protein
MNRYEEAHLKARAMLEHADRYEGLPQRDARDAHLRLWEYSHLETSWTLYGCKSAFYVRRIAAPFGTSPINDLFPPDMYGAEVVLPNDIGARIHEELLSIVIPPYRPTPNHITIDGIRRGVESFDYHRSFRVEWLDAPEEWRALETWFDRAIDAFTRHLPVCTFEIRSTPKAAG